MATYDQRDAVRAWGPAIRGVSYDGTAGLIARRVADGDAVAAVDGAILDVADRGALAAAWRAHLTATGDAPAAVRCAGGDVWLLGRDPAEVGVATPATAPEAPARGDVVAGRVALVTGAAQGFGWELAQGLEREGAWVVVADINGEGAAARARELDARSAARRGGVAAADAPARHLGLAVDVADEASVIALVDAIVDRYGGLDLVVSNAGVLRAGSVTELSLDDFTFVTRVNYTGFFVVTKFTAPVLGAQDAAWQAMRAEGAPSDGAQRGPGASGDPDLAHYFTDIVEINSKSGLTGSNRNGAYAGSKFGGIGLVQSFALELVEQGTKVNAICPGNFFDGPLWSDPDRGLFVQYLRTGKVPGAQSIADVRAAYEAKVPMGRGCGGRDVLRALLAAVEQRYETGQAIAVTGGQEMLR